MIAVDEIGGDRSFHRLGFATSAEGKIQAGVPPDNALATRLSMDDEKSIECELLIGPHEPSLGWPPRHSPDVIRTLVDNTEQDST